MVFDWFVRNVILGILVNLIFLIFVIVLFIRFKRVFLVIEIFLLVLKEVERKFIIYLFF